MVEPTALGPAIALLGHGEADDPAFGRGDPRDRTLGIGAGEKHFPHRADHAGPRVRPRTLGQGIEAVLRGQLPGDRGRAQGERADRPVAVARGHRAVDVPGLVRAVECADPEMDHADGLGGPVVAALRDLARQPVQCGGAEPHRR